MTCRLISVDPLFAPTVAAAVGRGYLREDLSDISVIGDSLEGLVVNDFKRLAKSYPG